MESVDEGVFRTTDMTEAAILVSNGFEYRLERLNRHMAMWAFTVSEDDEEKLETYVESYQSGNYRVEPRKFMEEIGRVRSELYKFLNRAPKRMHTPSPQTS